MPHSAGQRREKSIGRRGSKSSRPQRAVGAHDINELLSLEVRDTWTKSQNVLKAPGCALPAKPLSTALTCALRGSHWWSHTWHGPEGAPRQRQTLWVSLKPGFTHGRDTALPLTALSVFAINANQPCLPVSHVACLNEKIPPPYAKKI